MFDPKSYINQINVKSCRNCIRSVFDEGRELLVCMDKASIEKSIPVHENGLCDNFESKDKPKSKPKSETL